MDSLHRIRSNLGVGLVGYIDSPHNGRSKLGVGLVGYINR